MTPRFTWLSFALVSATILAAAGWLGATVWEQDARAQRAGILALWEQKVQAALWRMDAAASALVAREAARRPEEFAELARRDVPAEAPPAEAAPVLRKAMRSPAPEAKPPAGQAPPAPPPALPAADAAPAAASGNKLSARYFSRQLDAPAAAPPQAAAKAQAASARSARSAVPHPDPPLAAAAPAADDAPLKIQEKQELAALAGHLPDIREADSRRIRPAAARPTAEPAGASNAEAQLLGQVGDSYKLRSAAKDAIYENLDPAAGAALTALAENRDLVLARRVGAPGAETVQGVRLSAAAVSEELLALVRADFPRGRLEPERASPPPNLARTLAALPLRFDPGETPVLQTVWTPVRSAVSAAGAALLVALGAVALLLARTLALSERRAAFVSTMTHELRTPLTTFRLYTDLLEAAPDTADRARYTQVLAREAERLSHLVENVLAYARLERGRSKPAPKAQPVGELLAPAIDRLRERAERAGFALEVMPHDANLTVRADTATVEQILLNLVDNAGKYAVAADDRRLVLTAGKRGITLRDFGPGLDPVMHKRLFTPFSRSDREAAGNAPGVGLGLALCRRLAREMGGDLVYRKAGPGAEFTLVLPK